MFSNTQEKGPPKIVNNAPQIRRRNGFFPKCATLVPESFRSPRSQVAECAFTAHRGALLLLTLLFLSPQPAHPILLPQHPPRWVQYRGTPGQMRAGARTALHSHRPGGGVSRLRFSEHDLAVIARYDATATDQRRRFPMPKPPPPAGKRFSHTNDARHATSPNIVRRHMALRNFGARPYWRHPEESPPEDRNRLSRRLRPIITHRIERQNTTTQTRRQSSQNGEIVLVGWRLACILSPPFPKP